MPNHQSDGKGALTSLAGRLISCHADSRTEKLLRAFHPSDEKSADLVQLKVNFTFDETSLVKALDASCADVAHFWQGQEHVVHLRRDQEHAWISRDPSHAENLLLLSQARARVLVGHDSSHDASVTARPAVASLSAWATFNEVFPLHASAVCQESDGLVLVGEGGRGKTTTALALAMCGWDLIADDRCFVNTQNEELLIHALYRTSIVTSEVANRFPELLGEHIGITVEGKIASYLPKTIKFAQSTKLRGLVLLSPNHSEPYQMTRLTPREALAAWQQGLMFADSSLSPERSLFSLLTKASRTVPAWRMNLGWDFAMIDRVLRNHLESMKVESTS
jgi:hypothetical protein